MRFIHSFLMVSALGAAGCFGEVDYTGALVACDEGQCPAGFTCGQDEQCYPDDEIPDCLRPGSKLDCGAGGTGGTITGGAGGTIAGGAGGTIAGGTGGTITGGTGGTITGGTGGTITGGTGGTDTGGTGGTITGGAGGTGGCAGVVDECGVCDGPGLLTWYQDGDDDGLGDPAVSTEACSAPNGYVGNHDDKDTKCSENIGRDACNVCGGSGKATWYEDADDDGLGDPAVSVEACAQPDGFVSNADDTEPVCSGARDECGVCKGPGKLTWYDDTDGDRLGDPSISQKACTEPAGYVGNADDTDPACSEITGRDECGVCGGPGKTTWYEDSDDDQLGDPQVSVVACTQPAGFVSNDDDTDVECSAIVGRDECGVCDGPGKSRWYDDTDNDGLGDPNKPIDACTKPAGAVSNSGDTDPGCAASVGRDECNVCGGSGKPRWYDDTDGDGLGDPANSRLACTQPAGFVDNKNDTDPGCPESVGRDACNVCGGPGKSTWYGDSDDDGLGDPATSTQACAQPAGYVSNSNDTDPTCDDDIGRDVCGVCEGPGKPTWYDDTDGDGLGDLAVSTTSCTQPVGYVANSSDSDPECHVSVGRDDCGECGGDCVVCRGDMDITTDEQLADLALCDRVYGSVYVHGPAITMTSIGPMPLESISSQFRVGYDENWGADPLPNLTTVDLPYLETVYSQTKFGGNPKLASIRLPALKTVSVASLEFDNNPLLADLDISAFESCDSNVTVKGSLVTRIDLPNLTDAGGMIIQSNANLTHIEAPLLESLSSGHFWVQYNDKLATWSFGLLGTVSGSMDVRNNPLLSSCLALEVLAQIGAPGGSFNESGNLDCPGTCIAGVCE